MEFVNKNKSLTAMLIAATAIIINLLLGAIISLTIPAAKYGVFAAILSLLYSTGGMYVAGLLFYKHVSKTEVPQKTLLIASVANGVLVLLISLVFSLGVIASISFLASIAVNYIVAQQLLKRTVFADVTASDSVSGSQAAAAAKTGAQKAATPKAANPDKKNNLVIAVIVIIFVVLMAKCIAGGSGSSSSSGRKWSDLSDVEKENARWAYEVQQSINKNK